MNLSALTRFAAVTALGLATVGFVTAPAVACTNCGCSAAPMGTKAEKKEKSDIVETAASAGTFNTLLAAAEAAGLVETLQGEGPLTVLAPTDEAFAALPEGTVESLLKPENKDQLVAILTYHVIAGAVDAEAAMEAGTAETVNGAELTFAVESHDGHDHAQVNGVNIIKTDIETSNGIIHVIDAVLLPPAE